jgi:hypothetical protein
VHHSPAHTCCSHSGSAPLNHHGTEKAAGSQQEKNKSPKSLRGVATTTAEISDVLAQTTGAMWPEKRAEIRFPRPAYRSAARTAARMVLPLCCRRSHFWSPQSATAPPDRVRGAADNPDIRYRGGGADDPCPSPRRYPPHSRFATGALDDHIPS